jgi:cytochrome b pre-mRNA-processing protein 3
MLAVIRFSSLAGARHHDLHPSAIASAVQPLNMPCARAAQGAWRRGWARLATLFKRLLGGRDGAGAPVPLYDAIVRTARAPHWYVEGQVPDTIDGRFDMVSTVLSLVLLRLEALGEPARGPSARLAELFVSDMDGQLRQRGIGDLVVGKHVGRMMGQLGGRLTAYREGLAQDGDMAGAIARNVHRGADVADSAKAHVEAQLRQLATDLDARDLPALLAGDLP